MPTTNLPSLPLRPTHHLCRDLRRLSSCKCNAKMNAVIREQLLQEINVGKSEVLAWIGATNLFRVGFPSSSYQTSATFEVSRALTCWVPHLKLLMICHFHQPSGFVCLLSLNLHLHKEHIDEGEKSR